MMQLIHVIQIESSAVFCILLGLCSNPTLSLQVDSVQPDSPRTAAALPPATGELV